MYCKSISWLIFMYTAVILATCYRNTDSTTEWSMAESVREGRQEAGKELAALLDAGAGAVVTLEARGTRLVAHRAVLAARSPALAALLAHYSAEAGDQLRLPGVEGPVLRPLLAFLYTLQTPRLPPGEATQLLAAAHRFGLPALQADCERQVAEQLSVETAASAAVLAVKLSLGDLRDTAINFIKDHHIKVLATKGWADALENRPKEAAEMSRLLAERLAEIWNLSREERGARLLQAADEGAVGELRALLAAGADVEARDEHGGTALHRAAWRGHVEAASCLLRAGARVDAGDHWQRTPLHQAALRDRASMVRLLLAASADPNAKHKFGRSPLHYAAGRGRAEVVAALLQGGADKGRRSSSGRTPLDYAREHDHKHLFEMLTLP